MLDHLRILAPAVLLLPVLSDCGSESSASSEDGLQVVASFYPLEFVAERVAGEEADVSNLTPPGQDSHDAELSVSQTAQIMEADVLIHLSGYQPTVDEAVAQSEADHLVDAADGAELLSLVDDGHSHEPGDEDGDQDEEEHAEEEAHADEGQLDPHFWLDPTRLAAVAADVAGALSDADPANADVYGANLAVLDQQLSRLDGEFRDGLARCERDTVVVSHNAFQYPATRYGLDVHAIAGLSPEAEPSPAHLVELQDLIESEGVTTVFSERLASAQMAETLSSDIGIETAVLDPIEGLSDETSDEDYLSLMRANLAALQKANGCQ